MKTVAAELLNEGTGLLLLGRIKEAESRFRESMAINDNSAVAYNNLGFLLMQKGDYAASENAYRRALALDPNYGTAYTNLGIACIMQQQWGAAKEHLLKAIGLDADDVAAHESLAQLLQLQGDAAAAEYYWRKAYNLRPQSGILINLAQTLVDQQQLAEAMEVLQMAEQEEWGNIRFHVLLGAIHYLQYNFGAAIKSFRQALGIAPENTEVRHNLGMTLLATGKGPEAIQEFKRILLLEPANTDARNNLAVLELASGATGSARQHLDIVLEQASQNAKALYYKALLLFQDKEIEKALQILENTIATRHPEYGSKASELLAEINLHKSRQS